MNDEFTATLVTVGALVGGYLGKKHAMRDLRAAISKAVENESVFLMRRIAALERHNGWAPRKEPSVEELRKEPDAKP